MKDNRANIQQDAGVLRREMDQIGQNDNEKNEVWKRTKRARENIEI